MSLYFLCDFLSFEEDGGLSSGLASKNGGGESALLGGQGRAGKGGEGRDGLSSSHIPPFDHSSS